MSEHTPHRGNHEGYACGLSGPHCWACNEPWPCRASRAEEPKPKRRKRIEWSNVVFAFLLVDEGDEAP